MTTDTVTHNSIKGKNYDHHNTNTATTKQQSNTTMSGGKVLGLIFSPNVQRALLVAYELDLPVTNVPVDLRVGAHKTPEFLAKNVCNYYTTNTTTTLTTITINKPTTKTTTQQVHYQKRRSYYSNIKYKVEQQQLQLQ